MLAGKNEWWTNQKVTSMVTAHYIYSHLRSEDADKLTLRVFSTFTDDTYLQWILLKAKRLFLTLVDCHIAEHIFRLIDESYDDDDLPFQEDAIPALRLSQARNPNIDQIFYRNQFRYLCRVPEQSEHIRYAKAEAIPVQVLTSKTGNISGVGDRVTIPSQQPLTVLRKTIRLTEDQDEIDLLAEVASLHTLKHPHLLMIFATYSQGNEFFVLLQPPASFNLQTFLSNQPRTFEELSKIERRSKLFGWIACLSNALAWLHSNKLAHGAVRPSRILIDDDFHPTLGQFEGDSVLGTPTSKTDLEAYQYSAPELWKRELTYQSNAVSHGHTNSLGRHNSTKQAQDCESIATSRGGTTNNGGHDSRNISYAFSPVCKGNASRLKLTMYNRRTSVTAIPERDTESRMSIRPSTVREEKRSFQNLGRRFDTMSIKSNNSSEHDSRAGGGSKSLYFIPANKKAAIVQTWKSSVHDRFAADVFALSAIIMEALTLACGRTSSAFAKHRSAKNRQAGRGGGLADASFHANLPQVASWAETLHKDADKKMKKDEGFIFHAVGPTLQVVIQCLDREPQKRMGSSSLAKRMTRHLTEFAGLSSTHCSLQMLEERPLQSSSKQDSASAVPGHSWNNRARVDPRTIAPDTGKDEYDLTLEEQHVDNLPYHYARHQIAGESNSSAPSSPSSHVLVLDHLDRAPSRQLARAQMIPQGPQKVKGRVFIQESDDGSPPSLYSHETSTRYTESEPVTPVTTTSAHRSLYSTSPYSQAEYRPPDRSLPPVPSIPDGQRRMRSSVQSATKIRKSSSKQSMDVSEATDMLNSINSRRDTQSYPKLNIHTSNIREKGRPQIIQEVEDEPEVHFIVKSRTNRNTDFVHGHGFKIDSRGQR